MSNYPLVVSILSAVSFEKLVFLHLHGLALLYIFCACLCITDCEHGSHFPGLFLKHLESYKLSIHVYIFWSYNSVMVVTAYQIVTKL